MALSVCVVWMFPSPSQKINKKNYLTQNKKKMQCILALALVSWFFHSLSESQKIKCFSAWFSSYHASWFCGHRICNVPEWLFCLAGFMWGLGVGVWKPSQLLSLVSLLASHFHPYLSLFFLIIFGYLLSEFKSRLIITKMIAAVHMDCKH